MSLINVNKKVQSKFADALNYTAGNKMLTALHAEAVSDSSMSSFEDKGIQAGVMANFQRISDSAEGRAFGTTNNYGPFLPELLPIITAWYPHFPLKELISVQDMEQDLGYIVTSELLAGTKKMDTLLGDKVETPNGPRTIKGRYPTGEVYGEILDATALTVSGSDTVGALVYYPLITTPEALAEMKFTTTKASVDTSDWTLSTNVNGILTFTSATLTKSLTVEVATGIITYKADTAITNIVANYTWNIEYANNTNIPSVVEDMNMVPIQAKPRVLAMDWTIFSEYVKKKQFGNDIRTQTTKRVLDLMYQYLVRYILDKMYYNAAGTPVTVTVPTTSGIDLNVRVQQVLQQLNVVSQTVQGNTGRMEGNILVVGNDFKAYLDSLPNTFYTPFEPNKDYGFNGPRKIGSLGRYKVFYDDKLPTNAGWMSYKSDSQWYDAAYYLGIFMPITPTDIINIHIQLKSAFVSMEAHRFDKPMAVIPITFA